MVRRNIMKEVDQELLAVENVSKQQAEAFASDKLASLRKMVEEPPEQEITMVYLDEEGALQCVALSIDNETSEDDWVRLSEKAAMESFRVFEVLSMDDDGAVIIPDGPVLVGTPDDGTLLQALKLADGKREYYFSSRR
jgi:hypothetical protein